MNGIVGQVWGAIRTELGRRISDLRVEIDGSNQIVIHGMVCTYYLKQLASSTALRICNGSHSIVNAIAVVEALRHKPGDRNASQST
jgi:hypothetical protein